MTKKREDDLRYHKACDLLLAIQREVDRYKPDLKVLSIVLCSFVADVMEQVNSIEPGLGYNWRDLFVNMLNHLVITEHEKEERES